MTSRDGVISAIILCGGKSTRAGFDKQTLRIDGLLIAEWIAKGLSAAFEKVILVTNQPRLYSDSRCRVVEDIIQDRGPLGGIHAGLSSCTSAFAFVTACDMPNSSQAYLSLLKKKAAQAEGRMDAIAVRLENGMLEPMNALYAKRILPQIEEALAKGEPSVSGLLRRLNTRYVSEAEIMPFGGREHLFFNMNTPEEVDFFFAQSRCGKEEGR